ncbi:MAG TPA: aminoglycoside phosphotransferase family protein [Vicinamibacterales bacterium]|nr:aminoglycoside phosphotransferase family protein [Vicinamibacterales bacterium]
MPSAPLPNPEREWERSAPVASFDPADVERRLGPTRESLELLGGGHANLNIRVGAGRVLRIYRRDRGAIAKEKALLRRPWASLHVPTVLDEGADFLVLGYVPHAALTVSAEHGAQTGRALAEIHRTRFLRAGFLDGNLHVDKPFDDAIDALFGYARSEIDRAAPAAEDGDLRARFFTTFLAERLDALRAAAGGPVLLHADFKASNLHSTPANRLLVLDWEFAYSGPALMDVGQLLRWDPPAPFVAAFAGAYCDDGGVLPDGWRTWADVFDLFNLVGLLGGAAPESRRAIDVRARMTRTLAGG